MRIALVVTNFCDSSLALVRALSIYGHRVDFYFYVFKKDVNNDTCFDFVTPKRTYGRIYEVDYSKSKGVSFRCEYPNTHIYIYQGFPTGEKSKGIKGKIVSTIGLFFIKILSKHINLKQYDCVDIISQIPLTINFHKYIRNTKTIHSFHEIYRTHLNKKDKLPIIENTQKLNCKIRVFSDDAKDELISTYNVKPDRVFKVPFGLYYNYLDFGDAEIDFVRTLKSYILFIGYITPYKGLSVLYESVKMLKDTKSEINLVVAGKGFDDCLTKMYSESGFYLINKFVSNDELAYLISNCSFIVCPYLSISQSGIPQTAYVFNKPIIASNIGSFNKLVIDGRTGFLVNPGNILELSNAIKKLLDDNILYSKFVSKIKKFEHENTEYCWNNIVDEYIFMINNY